jgi:hypothetical protein
MRFWCAQPTKWDELGVITAAHDAGQLALIPLADIA